MSGTVGSMSGTPPEEGIGLLTGEEEESRAVGPGKSPRAAAPAPATPAPPPTPKPEAPSLLEFKAADESTRDVTAGTVTTLSAVLTNGHPNAGTATVELDIVYTSTYPGEGADWPVAWMPPGARSFSDLVAKTHRRTLELPPHTPVAFQIQITAPV